MNVLRQIELPERFRVVVTLAQLLETLENGTARISADQYRSVVRHLADELGTIESGAEFDAILKSFPAAAELYENQRYEQAGLCRSPLERSLNTEQQARSALARIAAL